MTKIGYKWGVHRTLMGDRRVKSALPETVWFSEENLWSMLKRHKTVILKPSGGTGGWGVIRVRDLGGHRFEIHSGPRKRIVSNRKTAFTSISSITRSASSRYLIQRCIDLATFRGAPIDIRVMVQRKRSTPWTVTGHLAKIAGKGYIVTNVALSKGFVLPVRQALKGSNMSGRPVQAVIRDLCDTALWSAQRLGRFSTVVGFDMGVDVNGRVWMIEANPKPAISLFLKLKDKSMYRTIMAYMKR
jgi:hypothetical protein